jgi:membrane-associated phospholipid phosphatase
MQINRTATLRNWAISFVVMVAAVIVSYYWLDQPIALFAHEQLKQYNQFELLTHIPEVAIPIILVAFMVLGFWALTRHSLNRFETVLALDAITLAVAIEVKVQLKYAFGRTWPETWVRDNPSLIRDGVYGFFPFHGGAGYSSFPSGHTTAICAVMSVFWICYPRYRIVYAVCIAAVAIGLVGANFHFLSDVIAGGFLGASAGWMAVFIWELGEHRIRPPASPKVSGPFPVEPHRPTSSKMFC